MREIFLRVWDTKTQGYDVRLFDSDKITSLVTERAPPDFPSNEIKSSFIYNGEKYLCTDEEHYILNMMRVS